MIAWYSQQLMEKTLQLHRFKHYHFSLSFLRYRNVFASNEIEKIESAKNALRETIEKQEEMIASLKSEDKNKSKNGSAVHFII